MEDSLPKKISHGVKVALVHDFLLYWGGAERVLKGLTTLFPQAPIYTLFYNKTFTDTFFPDRTMYTSFLQYIPFSHRLLLPLMPWAVEQLRIDDADIVISSGAFSKGIITRPSTRHIHYCHTPPRFLWEDAHTYLRSQVPFGLRRIASFSSHWLRIWDTMAAQRPDVMLANSQWTRQKIKKIYRRDAQVVYPFIETQNEKRKTKNYFLIVSRLQNYKHIDLAIQVFNHIKLPLVIAGAGPDEKRLKRLAGGTIEFLGFVEDDALPELYANARAVILPGVEDFGLVPIEAMAQGTPVIAYRKGGAQETIIEGNTGEFFDALTVEALQHSIKRFITKERAYNHKFIQSHAQRFSFEQFKIGILSAIEKARFEL